MRRALLAAALTVVATSQALPASAGATVAPTTATGAYVAVAPTRILDTRTAAADTATPAGQVPANGSVTLPVTNRAGVPSSVAAVAVNVTVTGPARAGYLTAWPAGTTRPVVSTLNYAAGQTVANAAVVPVSPGGAISLYSVSRTDVVVDVVGYVAGAPGSQPTAPGSVGVVTPVRLVDTRSAATAATPAGSIPAGGSVVATLAGRGGIPAGATAVVANLTAVQPAAAGYLSAWPTGGPQPVVSTLNFRAGQIVANLAVLPVSSDGRVSVYSPARTDLLVDVVGYVVGGSGAPGVGAVVPVAPTRVLDSRSAATDPATPVGAVAAGATKAMRVVGRAGVPYANVAAVAVNVTVTNTGAPGYVTAWPSGQARPVVSTLNFAPRQTVANAALVPVGPDGSIDLYSVARTDVIVDVVGYVVAAPRDATAPAPVTGLTATPTTAATVALSWTNPTAGDLVDVAVVRKAGTTPPTSPTDGAVVQVDAPAGSDVDSGLTPETSYSYAVFAQDTSGNSSTPATATVTTPVGPSVVGSVLGIPGRTPVGGAVVTAYDGGISPFLVLYAHPLSSGTSRDDGTYVLPDLPPNRHLTLCVDGARGTGSRTGWSATCQQVATAATPGTGVLPAEPLLVHAGGEVAGTVTTGGRPLSGVIVRRDLAPAATTTTDAGGAYDTSGVARRLCFDASADRTSAAPYGYASRCLNVAVAVGGSAPGPAVDLAPGGEATGTVTDERGRPVAGVVAAIDAGTGGFLWATTDAAGRYAIDGLPAGTYEPCLFPELDPADADLIPRCSHQGYSAAPTVVVSEGRSSTVPAVALGTGSTVTGVVRSGSRPVSDAMLMTHGTEASRVWSDASGRYVARALTPGALQQLDVTGGADPTGAGYRSASVLVTPQLTQQSLDIGLVQGAGASGRVVDVQGRPVAGALVAYDPDVRSAADGTFHLTGLSSGYHALDAGSDDGTGTTVTGYLRSASDADDLVTGRLTPVDDLVLPDGGAMSGTVRDAHGNRLGGIYVQVIGGSTQYIRTAIDGTYVVRGLSTDGDSFCGLSDGYVVGGDAVAGYRDDCRATARADGAGIQPGHVLSGADFTLQYFGGVRGGVADPNDVPISDATVELLPTDSSGGLSAHIAYTGADGSFEMQNVAPGTYAVCVADETPARSRPAMPTGFAPTCVGGVDREHAAPITVRADEVTSRVDVTMTAGGGLDVLARSPSGAALEGVSVAVGERFTYTDESGRASLAGLAAGSTRVCLSSITQTADRYGDAFPCQSVTETAGAFSTVDARSQPAGALSVSLEDKSTGNPLYGDVIASGKDSQDATFLATTTAPGQLGGLLPQTYTVCSTGNGSYAQTCATTSVVANKQTAVTLVLRH